MKSSEMSLFLESNSLFPQYDISRFYVKCPRHYASFIPVNEKLKEKVYFKTNFS